MYFYKVSWSHFEDYDPKEFTSEKKWSKRQFDTLIKELIEQACTKLLGVEGDLIGNAKIMKEVWKILETKGFIPVMYQAEYDLYGSCYIDKDDISDSGYNKVIDKKLLRQIIAHNMRIVEV